MKNENVEKNDEGSSQPLSLFWIMEICLGVKMLVSKVCSGTKSLKWKIALSLLGNTAHNKNIQVLKLLKLTDMA